MRPDSTAARRVVADVSAFCRGPCRTFFRMRADKFQRLILFRPDSITQRLGRSTHFFTTADEPNTSMPVMPKHSRDLEFAQNSRELFPRSNRRMPLCPRFVLRVDSRKTTPSF